MLSNVFRVPVVRTRTACFALQSEERRNRAMQPYRVTTPRRGIIGNSTYADRLRRQVRTLAWNWQLSLVCGLFTQ